MILKGTKKRLFWLSIIFLLGTMFHWLFFDIFITTQAATEEETATETKEKEEALDSLEQKARNYQRMIDLKQQQSVTLKNQMSLMDLEIENCSNEIEKTEEDIKRNRTEISALKDKIIKTENEIEKNRNDLKEMIEIYHQIDEEFSMEILANRGNIAEILNQSEYIDQTSQEVEKLLGEIEEKKEGLEGEKEIFEEKNNELGVKESSLREKVYDLDNEKVAKKVILNKTQGEEAKYQKMLERVERQKAEIMSVNALSGATQKELKKILEKAKKPKKKARASTSWYYAQNDERWGNKRIGLSSSLMKNYGCAVTALSMVFSYHQETIKPDKLASQPIFYQDLIVWPRHWKGLNLVSSTAHGGVDWKLVDAELKNGNPVIIFVRSGTGAGHYVVIHGKDKKKYVVHDPLFGANLYLETTRKLVGAVYGTSTVIDQVLIYHDDK